MPRTRTRLALIVMFASCMVQAAMADQTKVFQWRDAKGATSYSQSPPPPGTPGVTTLEVDTRSFTPAQRAAARAELAHIDAAKQAESARYRAQIASADQAVKRALQSLAQAERAAVDARVPHSGDRIGNANGGSRLRSDYFDRQKRLEDDVANARASLEEAYRRRNQIMP